MNWSRNEWRTNNQSLQNGVYGDIFSNINHSWNELMTTAPYGCKLFL